MKNIERQCTTIEQSKRLVELGFTEDSASARIVHLLRNDWVVITDNFVCYDEEYPCWTIADMIEILHSRNNANNLVCNYIVPNVFFRQYKYDDEGEVVDSWVCETFTAKSFRDNLFNCLVWLKENKYL